MACPNCGGPTGPEDAFCGNCGADLRGAPQAPRQNAQPTPQPTQEMPQQPPSYGQQPPPLTQQPPSYDQQAYPQADPYAPSGWRQPAAGPGAPPPSGGSKTVIIVIAAVLAVVVLAGGAFGAFLLLRGDGEADDTAAVTETVVDPVVTPTEPDTDPTGDAAGTASEEPVTEEAPEPIGFSTPIAALEDRYGADWVFDPLSEAPDRKEFRVGPPASEFIELVVVERAADGSWVISGASEYVFEGGVEESPERVVFDFLDAIMEDRPEDAQALTIPPFSNDPASASYSNGDFYGYEFVEVVPDGDAYWVRVREEWVYGVEPWQYHVVPTDAGYRIDEMSPW